MKSGTLLALLDCSKKCGASLYIETIQQNYSKKLPWLAQTKVITLKTQLHAVNAR